MLLYLIRHGNALSNDIDSQRALSLQGQGEVKDLANLLLDKNIEPQNIGHSGILRAEQTAKIIQEILNPRIPIAQVEGLRPESDPTNWADLLHTQNQDLMLVGHMPFMGLMVEELTGRTTSFHTASCACIERDNEGMWILQWQS
jgi:phosphohistidine phosphatase